MCETMAAAAQTSANVAGLLLRRAGPVRIRRCPAPDRGEYPSLTSLYEESVVKSPACKDYRFRAKGPLDEPTSLLEPGAHVRRAVAEEPRQRLGVRLGPAGRL